jgi:hypothetical protein
LTFEEHGNSQSYREKTNALKYNCYNSSGQTVPENDPQNTSGNNGSYIYKGSYHGLLSLMPCKNKIHRVKKKEKQEKSVGGEGRGQRAWGRGYGVIS